MSYYYLTAVVMLCNDLLDTCFFPFRTLFRIYFIEGDCMCSGTSVGLSWMTYQLDIPTWNTRLDFCNFLIHEHLLVVAHDSWVRVGELTLCLEGQHMKWMLIGVTGFTVVLLILFIILYRLYLHEKHLSSEWWRVYWVDIHNLSPDEETTGCSKDWFHFILPSRSLSLV